MTLHIMSKISKKKNICLTESETNHIILRSQKYFMNSTLLRANVTNVLGPTDQIESLRRAMILLSNSTKFYGFDFAESKY